MKRTMTKISCLALRMTATGLALIAHPTGAYSAFRLDGVLNYTFAYIGGQSPQLLLLVGDMKQSFDVVGVAKVSGPDIQFVLAEIDRDGVVAPAETVNNGIRDSGHQLTLDLGEILVQMAAIALGESNKVTLELGDQMRFRVDEDGHDTLSIFTVDRQLYGVFKRADKLHAMKISLVDGHYRPEELAGSPYKLTDVHRSIVDLTAAANSPLPIPAGAGRGHLATASA